MQAHTKITAVTRILNEEQLIEPFVRHHASIFDTLILLDDGSTDRTLEILRALHAEGLPVQLYQGSSPVYSPHVVAAGLYRLAVEQGADWVGFLDCDEFLDMRRLPDGLGSLLAGVAPAIRCIAVPSLDYLAPAPGAADHLNPVLRLTRRRKDAVYAKILVRRLAPARVAIAPGNHYAVIDEVPDRGVLQDILTIAHFPDRSRAQYALKAVLGRLKVLAAGQSFAPMGWSEHYVGTFEAMKADPRAYLAGPAAPPPDTELADDPIDYLGGALTHTRPADDEARLLSLLLVHAERLARSHGDILDRKRLIRRSVMAAAATVRRVL